MNIQSYFRDILFSLLLIPCLISCNKDDLDIRKFSWSNLQPVAALPLIHSRMDVYDLLPDDLIDLDSNNVFVLIYEKEIQSFRAGDSIHIPDQQNSFLIDDIYLEAPQDQTIELPYFKDFGLVLPESGQRLDSCHIKSAIITLKFTSSINHDCKVNISLPSAFKDGLPFETTLDYEYEGTSPVTDSIILDFSGYRFITNPDGDMMQLPLDFVVEVTGDDHPNLSPYYVQLDVRISGIEFSAIYGYLGQYEYQLKDSVELDIFKNTLQGLFYFKELRLSFTTLNSIGMPIEMVIDELTAHSPRNPPYVVDLTDHPQFPNPLRIPSPDILHAGHQAESTFVFTPSNCNLNEALSICPRYIDFSVTGKSNPDNDPTDENFDMDSSRFSLKAVVELPFFGSVEGFILEDTLDFSIEDNAKLHEIEFVVVSVNRFPIDARIQVYFTDDHLNVLDSLIYGSDPYLVRAAAVSGPPDYRVITAPPPHTFIPQRITRERLDKLTKCTRMICHAGLNTTNNGLVKIYSDYDIDLTIGAKVYFSY